MSNMVDKVNFPIWLEEKINETGLSMSAFAIKARVHRQDLWNYINKGVEPKEDKLIAIAKGLGIPARVIFEAAGRYYPDVQKVDDPWVETMEHKIKKIPASLRPIAETLLDSLLEQEEKMTAAKTRKKIIPNEK
jgi:transcriptional regulator with XRE-family HTH domain